MRVFVITTGYKGFDWEVDHITEGKHIAEAHVRDLRAMGCDNVKVRGFATWDEANKFADKVRGE